jgi:hypothetical protein
MPSSARFRTGWVVVAIVFALTPWVTLGWGTPFAFAFAALVRRSVLLGAAAVVYAVALTVLFATAGRPDGTTADSLFGGSLIVAMLIGGVHAAACSPWIAMGVRRKVPRRGLRDELSEASAQERAALAYDPALRLALRQRERRRLAREIVANDPSLAAELAIGRPDLDRDFVDGGLIDVNGVPAWILTDLPGFTQAMADRVVAARDHHEGLRSAADLVVYAHLPAEMVDALSEVLVFRPWIPPREQ